MLLNASIKNRLSPVASVKPGPLMLVLQTYPGEVLLLELTDKILSAFQGIIFIQCCQPNVSCSQTVPQS